MENRSPQPPLPLAGPAAKRRAVRTACWLVVLLATATYLRVAEPIAGQRAVAGLREPAGYRFMFVDTETGEPVRYNACEPIHYVINPSLAPAGAVDDVHAAIEMTSQSSGLKFAFDGFTDETPVAARELSQPERYDEGWAPVLFAWTSGPPAIDGVADATILGKGGSAYEINDDGRPVYVTGLAVFDGSADLEPGFGGETWGQAILHELGHVLGLNHVDDPGSVMNPVIDLRPATWMDADRAGLWRLGLGSPCLSTPVAP